MKSGTFRLLINLYPPFWGTGIHVTSVSPDFRAIDVRMRLRFFNRNYVGTHFGGSLYAMTDPFYMVMLIRNLGPAYVVWDKRVGIDFIRPGRSTVYARFRLEESRIEEIRQRADREGKTHPEFSVEVADKAGQTVARVTKTLYVRRRQVSG